MAQAGRGLPRDGANSSENFMLGLNRINVAGALLLALASLASTSAYFGLAGDLTVNVFLAFLLMIAIARTGWLTMISQHGWLNVWFLSFGTFVMFLCARPMLDLVFQVGDAYVSSYFYIGTFTRETMVVTLNCLLAFTLGWMVAMRPGGVRFALTEDNRSMIQLGLALWVAAIPFHLVKVIWFAREGLGNYLAFYTGEASFPPIWVTFPASFLTLGFYLFLCGRPSHRIGKWITAVHLALVVLLLFKGSRAELYTALITAVWLYFFVYGKRAGLVQLALGIVLIAVSSQVLSIVRLGEIVSSDDVSGAMFAFAWNQGVSVVPLMFVIENYPELFSWVDGAKAFVAPVASLLEVLFRGTFAQMQLIENADSQFALGEKIGVLANPELYQTGQAMGTSALAEVFLIGGLPAVFLLGFVECKLLNALATNARYWQGPGLFFLAALLPNFLFLPRDTVLAFLVPAAKAIVVLGVYAIGISLNRRYRGAAL